MKVGAIGFSNLCIYSLMELVGLFLACSSLLFYFLLLSVSCFNKLSQSLLKGQEIASFRCGLESEGDTAMKLLDWDLLQILHSVWPRQLLS